MFIEPFLLDEYATGEEFMKLFAAKWTRIKPSSGCGVLRMFTKKVWLVRHP